MAKCCIIETRGSISNPMPKSSAISKGVSIVEFVLNSQGNCHSGKPPCTKPVKVSAVLLSYTSEIRYAIKAATMTTIELRETESAHLDFWMIRALLASGSVPSSHLKSFNF